MEKEVEKEEVEKEEYLGVDEHRLLELSIAVVEGVHRRTR